MVVLNDKSSLEASIGICLHVWFPGSGQAWNQKLEAGGGAGIAPGQADNNRPKANSCMACIHPSGHAKVRGYHHPGLRQGEANTVLSFNQ